MKFRIVSHACLWVEAGETRFLTDPWLIGSCYWRSWWHAPRAELDLFDPAEIDAIYYTHEHPDHLHFPSLRRFPRDTRILVPKFPVDRIRPMLSERGFEHVEEIPHAASVHVGPLEIHSYQFGLDDSAVVISDGQHTLLNLNDSKAGGLALDQVLRRHPRVDFLFRSHAPAQSYPFCYSADDPADLELLPEDYYTKSFAAAAKRIQPRFAIPFASNVCHLHPESQSQNQHLVAPEAVAATCRGVIGDAEVVILAPGDGWDADLGFQISDPGATRRIPEIIRELATEKRSVLERYSDEENALAPIDPASLEQHLLAFCRAVPWPLRRAFPFRVAFELPASEFLIVDLRKQRIEMRSQRPDDVDSVVRANAHLLRDALDKYCLNLVGISKRLRVHLHRGGLVPDAAFWGLLAVYELGYLPVRSLLRPRPIAALWRRWREFAGYAKAVATRKPSLESIIESWDPRADT